MQRVFVLDRNRQPLMPCRPKRAIGCDWINPKENTMALGQVVYSASVLQECLI